jgi:hypothetical protein
MRDKFFFLFFLIAFLPVACTMPGSNNDKKIVDTKQPGKKDAFHRLCQYWEVSDAENPTLQDINDQPDSGIQNIPGIIFMTDSTFLENPRAVMRYGRFELKGPIIDAQFDDGKKAVYHLQEVDTASMLVKRVESDHTTTLHLTGSHVFWPDVQTNPYSKGNNAWRIKPSKAESMEALRERLQGCVQFYEYFFAGHAESDADEIDFRGLPSCFKWYQGGIFVQGPKKLDKKWINCFYSTEQALQARQMMEDALSKKYDWDTTQTNWIKQTALVLKQIHDKM